MWDKQGKSHMQLPGAILEWCIPEVGCEENRKSHQEFGSSGFQVTSCLGGKRLRPFIQYKKVYDHIGTHSFVCNEGRAGKTELEP